jgi:hypothetical protein
VHDAKGNMTSDGTRSFAYGVENRLLTDGTRALYHEPLGRLYHISSPYVVFEYDGTQLISEYDSHGAMTRRYVHGPGVDEPLVQYEVSGTTNRKFLHADERGSIITVSDNSGNVLGINKYDEYGKPQGPSGEGTLIGRFGYTGQAWLPELQLYYYKARMLDPDKGREAGPPRAALLILNRRGGHLLLAVG